MNSHKLRKLILISILTLSLPRATKAENLDVKLFAGQPAPYTGVLTPYLNYEQFMTEHDQLRICKLEFGEMLKTCPDFSQKIEGPSLTGPVFGFMAGIITSLVLIEIGSHR